MAFLGKNRARPSPAQPSPVECVTDGLGWAEGDFNAVTDTSPQPGQYLQTLRTMFYSLVATITWMLASLGRGDYIIVIWSPEVLIP